MHRKTSLLLLLLAAAACGRSVANEQPNQEGPTAGSGFEEVTAGSAGSKELPGASGNTTIPTGGSLTTGGGPTGSYSGGSSGSGGSGGSDVVPPNAYAPRSGKFKMVVYSKTVEFRLAGSIATGTSMLQEIATEWGLEPPLVTEENTFLDEVDDYELVFFLNPSGDVFSDEDQAKFEAWMKKGGAFCGTSAATDTERGWSFYMDVIGQHYEGHGLQNTLDSIVFEASALDHPALVGLPSPWERHETWRLFKSSHVWSIKPGFRILARKAADQEPIIWLREHDNYRSFYTGIGWDGVVFQDPEVKKHLTGAIMWAVRREHCLATPKLAGCP